MFLPLPLPAVPALPVVSSREAEQLGFEFREDEIVLQLSRRQRFKNPGLQKSASETLPIWGLPLLIPLF